MEAQVSHKPVLEVKDLSVEFERGHRRSPIEVVRGINLAISPGETVALVGESGSGKSVTALSILGLLGRTGSASAGTVALSGQNLLDLPEKDLRAIRGDQISMVLQDALTSLNPLHTIGHQIAEVLRLHQALSRRDAWARALELLDAVHVPDPPQRAREYPHQLSGGMRQRVMIAIALACRPALLIADEPTTALDVTVEAQVLKLIATLCREDGTAVLLITHNLGIVADVAQRVLVMYGGEIVEAGPTSQVLANPCHPYTRGLLDSQPERAERGQPLRIIPGSVPHPSALGTGCPFASRCAFVTHECRTSRPLLEPVDGGDHLAACPVPIGPWRSPPASAADIVSVGRAPVSGQPLLEVRGLSKSYARSDQFNLRRSTAGIRAVTDVSFSILPGETLGLVGESGCGKSTTARMIARLIKPTAGTILLDGEDITQLTGESLRQRRRDIQIIFQDPFGSLNPRHRIKDSVTEPLSAYGRLGGAEQTRRATELLELVGLSPDFLDRAPHQLSGGQRQRVSIARALALEPKLLVCDEPVASLDVSIQAQVLNLLEDLQERLGLAYLFISHDLGVIRHISDRIAVMYLGRIVELGATETVFADPRHPYTQTLIAATPGHRVDGRESVAEIPGTALAELPSAVLDASTGCAAASRCRFAQEICRSIRPELAELPNGSSAACHFAQDRSLRIAAAASAVTAS